MVVIAARVAATMHNILYVMAEGSEFQRSEQALRKLCFLFLIDFLQVVRVVTSPFYGWSAETSTFVQNFDVVFLFTEAVSRVVPRYSFFIFASMLVLVALADTVYVARLFSSGEVNKLWPVKVLRFLVSALVTTFFSSVIKWLLIPVDCLVTDREQYMSVYMHGPGASCDPWRSPELAISILTLLLAACYCLFALTASLFWLEINPLSCSPAAKCTGRVEMSFLSMKIAATILVYLAGSITTLGTSICLFLYSVYVFQFHLHTLPFHNKFANQLRGGIHAALMWLAFCAVIVSATNNNDGEELPVRSQMAQWAFVICVPFAAILGAWAVALRRNQLVVLLDRLRGHWEVMGALESNEAAAADAESTTTSKPPGAKALVATGVYDYFYTPSLERKRAFSSTSQAYAALRVLLHKRAENDLPFLLHLLHRAMAEFPQCHVLRVFFLLLMRFVVKDTKEEESVRKSTQNLPLSVDLKYAIYAVERKRSQELASASIGRGTVNAINLMEYDSGLERARKAHTKCISHLKKFWHLVGKQNNRKRLEPSLLADRMLDELSALDPALSEACEAYESLLHKYPSSLAVLQGYSHFCDTVLNDNLRAKELREKALAEEGVSGTANAAEDSGRSVEDGIPSSQSSASDSASLRTRAGRAVGKWISEVMAAEREVVVKLQRRERVLLLLLLLGVTASFVASSVVLYTTEAKKYMHLVSRTGELRIKMATAAFELRSQMMSAWGEDAKGFEKSRERIVEVAQQIRTMHYDNYRNVVSPSIADMYNHPVFATFLPVGGVWKAERQTLWDMVNDAARRSELAAWSTMAELRDSNYTLDFVSEEKRNVQYVHENWLRTLSPSLSTLIGGYKQQMQRIGNMIQSVVVGACAGNSFLIVLLFSVIIRALVTSLQNLQHKQLACGLAEALPRSVARKLYLFFRRVDLQMRIMEDEEMERMYTEGLLFDEEEENAANTADEQEAEQTPETLTDGLVRSEPASEFAPVEPLTIDNVEAHVKLRLHSPEIGPKQFAALAVPAIGVQVSGSQAGDDVQVDAVNNAPDLSAVAGKWNTTAWPANKTRTVGGATGNGATQVRDREMVEEEPAAEQGAGGSEVVMAESRQPASELSRTGEEQQAWDILIEDEDGDDKEEFLFKVAEALAKNAAGPARGAAQPELELETRPGPARALPLHAAQARYEPQPEAASVLARDASLRPPDRGVGRVGVDAQAPQPEEQPGQPLQEQTETRGSTAEERVAQEAGVLAVCSSKEPPAPASAPAPAPAAPTKLQSILPRGMARAGKDGIEFSSRGKVHFTEPDSRTLKRKTSSRLHGSQPLLSDIGLPSDDGARVSEEKCETSREAERLELRQTDPLVMKRVKQRLRQDRSFFLQTTVYVICFLVLLGYNLLFHLYPARTVGDLVNLAPMIDLASSRVFQTLALSSLSRELVLNDGFSRMSKPSLMGAIKELKERLSDANFAIRYGGRLGIKAGADTRNEEHNRIMYSMGCPWREDPTNCTMKAKPQAASSGLLFLVNTYVDSLESVLRRYARDTLSDDQALRLEVDGYRPYGFESINFAPERAEKLRSDVDVAFLQENFEGDMTKGFRLVMETFSDEADSILAGAEAESELFYTIFILLLILCYHLALFRKTIQHSLAEVEKAREFVLRQPIHTLDHKEHQVLASFFSPNIQVGGPNDPHPIGGASAAHAHPTSGAAL